MPCPHFEMNIVQRSEGQSAVAAAAYQSGKKLYSEYDQATMCFVNKKSSKSEGKFPTFGWGIPH